MSIWSLLRVKRIEPQSEETDLGDRTVGIVGTRRNLSKLLGIGAAGAVGVSVLEASPASAGTGNGADVQLGQTTFYDKWPAGWWLSVNPRTRSG